MNNSQVMPALFLSHGSPLMGLKQTPTSDFFHLLGETLPTPKAIVVFSAHFNVHPHVVITSGKRMKTIHDFYGFPQPLYEINYPAQGAPDIAKQAADLLNENGIKAVLDEKQGLDHGAWMPLMYMYPNLDIPVIQISIDYRADIVHHYEMGLLLRPLREQGVLFVGSGGISHNLREVFADNPDPKRVEKVYEFTDWVAEKITQGDSSALLDYRAQGPHAAFNHPTPDHYYPLPCILGTLYDGEKGQVLHRAMELDIISLDAYGFGPGA